MLQRLVSSKSFYGYANISRNVLKFYFILLFGCTRNIKIMAKGDQKIMVISYSL
ncbi:hypothetical protein D3C85_1484200 [compost metagenome]